ncbi:flagellar basal-body rod protein FlgF [Paenisporosarcina sp. TG-14]|uniref:flagellar basal-body rod protein FlgF n=1 Tax=Paenisporosarcina sp. TG-14 TaxID=1231057 RepID=UPI000305907A|nr:flagellar basal-body rod protein FlgF [Paenisporosarcina sp. TG-14]
MLRSMYSGVSGMKGFQTKLDVIGNNISNVNTIGYKKSTINFQDLLSQNLSNSGVNPMQVGLGSTTSSINVIHTPGASMTTGVGTDLAIMGDGFFVVQAPGANGGQFLTRAGNFVLNADGELVTSQGYNVLDSNSNPIKMDPSVYDSFTINRSGEVIGKQPNGTETSVATIGISSPENPSGLRKSGGSLYEMTGAASPTGIDMGTAATKNTQIGSGQLEMSNVDLTEEFTEMIIAQRGFQANSRTITTSDEMLQEVINLKR